MVTSTQILENLNRQLAEKYKDVLCYIDSCPAQFQRPCFLIAFLTEEQQAATRVSVKKTAEYAITYFGKTDGYANSKTEELLEMQDGLQKITATGYLKLGNRALQVQAGKGGRGPDWVKIELKFEYYDDRPLPTEGAEPAEKMKEIHTKIQ